MTEREARSLSTRPLGRTGLMVSPVGIGCAPLGDMPETFDFSVPEQRAKDTLRAVLESPINLLDTAAAYGDGESERRIGAVLGEMGGLPAGCVLATKADRSLTTGDFSGDQMRRSVERSLELLGLDELQLVHLHDPEYLMEPNREPFEYMMAPGGPVEVLRSFKEEGVIRHLGIAGGPIDLLMRFVETGLFETVMTHNRYTLIETSAEPLLDLARDRRVAVFNAAPYGSGILAKGPDKYARYEYREASRDIIEKAKKAASICREFDVPLPAAALQFSLRDERIASTVVGMTRPERVAQTLELARHPIPDELWEELDSFPGSGEAPG